jgi:hypothetical protein
MRIRSRDHFVEHRDKGLEVVVGSRTSGRVVLLAVDRSPVELPAGFEAMRFRTIRCVLPLPSRNGWM